MLRRGARYPFVSLRPLALAGSRLSAGAEVRKGNRRGGEASCRFASPSPLPDELGECLVKRCHVKQVLMEQHIKLVVLISKLGCIRLVCTNTTVSPHSKMKVSHLT